MTPVQPGLLRSVSLADDLGHPSRFMRYVASARSTPLIAAMLDGGPVMAIAPYGSGKSLAAGIAALLLRNDAADRGVLAPLVERLAHVDVLLGDVAADRLDRGIAALVHVLSGHVEDLAADLRSAFGLPENLSTLGDVLSALPAGEIVLIWDEFGRHLEQLVTSGNTWSLDQVQHLSEWAARRDGTSLCLLLHQGFGAYAATLGQAARNEWRKIEGRFRQIRFVEDSKAAYDLLASIVAHRPGVAPGPEAAAEASWVARLGWFDGMDEPDVADLLRRARPFTAAALHVLPRLAARLGQHERTVSSIASTVDVGRCIGTIELWSTFSDAIRVDVGVGGLHRTWLVADRALGLAGDELEREAVAAACLFGIASVGDRRLPRRAEVEAALRGRGASTADSAAAIDRLLARKLLIHRKRNDALSLWQGAEVDLDRRLSELRTGIAGNFDLVAALAREAPAPYVRPVRHNVQFGTCRYLPGSYLKAEDLLAADPATIQPSTREIGAVRYVLCETDAQCLAVRSNLERHAAAFGRTVFVVPAHPIDVSDALLELAALLMLKEDKSLLDEDPLAGSEIDYLLADARGRVNSLLHRLITDRPAAAMWMFDGKPLCVDRDRSAGIAVSSLLDDWFPLTPVIVNEQIMRRSLSRPISTSRIRIITRILEKAHEPRLGLLEAEESLPIGSLYRTVLERVGLHKASGGVAWFAEPACIADPGMRAVWAECKTFMTVPGKRSLDVLVDRLSAPPFGLPDGVIPIIVMAAYRAFARAACFRVDGSYVRDLLGFDATRMFQQPENQSIVVCRSGPAEMRYLADLAEVFGGNRPGDRDELVGSAWGAIDAWRGNVAAYFVDEACSDSAAALLMAALGGEVDPPGLLFERLPRLFGGASLDFDRTVREVASAKADVDRIGVANLEQATAIVRTAFPNGFARWYRDVAGETVVPGRSIRTTEMAILRVMREALTPGGSVVGFVRSVVLILLAKPVEQWRRESGTLLADKLADFRTRVEDAALARDMPPIAMLSVVEARIAALQALASRMREDGKAEPRETA